MNVDKFKEAMGDEWAGRMSKFIESEKMDDIYQHLRELKGRGKVICPDSSCTFRAFKETPYSQLKVIWLLQNPYPWVFDHNMVADGIALSCSNTDRAQPSLKLFYDGMKDDLSTGPFDRRMDLSYLCNQGIMMLNTSLTVEKDKPGSQVELWLPFMRYLFEEVITKLNNGLIIVFSGQCSMHLRPLVFDLQHHVIETEHPAAAARQNRPWDHNNVFTKINELLKENYNFEPDWIGEVPF